MALEIRLTQKIAHQLTLTPQLKTSIDILQLPLLELAARIQQELAENPVLEEQDPTPAEDSDYEKTDANEGDTELPEKMGELDPSLESVNEEWQDNFQTSPNASPEAGPPASVVSRQTAKFSIRVLLNIALSQSGHLVQRPAGIPRLRGGPAARLGRLSEKGHFS